MTKIINQPTSATPLNIKPLFQPSAKPNLYTFEFELNGEVQPPIIIRSDFEMALWLETLWFIDSKATDGEDWFVTFEFHDRLKETDVRDFMKYHFSLGETKVFIEKYLQVTGCKKFHEEAMEQAHNGHVDPLIAGILANHSKQPV
jgi:hypothetical protein